MACGFKMIKLKRWVTETGKLQWNNGRKTFYTRKALRLRTTGPGKKCLEMYPEDCVVSRMKVWVYHQNGRCFIGQWWVYHDNVGILRKCGIY